MSHEVSEGGQENESWAQKAAEGVTDAACGLVSGAVDMAVGLGQSLWTVGKGIKDLGDKAWDRLTETEEEEAARKKEEADKKAAEKAAEEEAKKAEELEAQRMAALQEMYIVHGAAILCSYGRRCSSAVLQVGHGEYIHGIDQMNIGDRIPDENILTFGVCTSPGNPSVQEKAKEIMKEVQEEETGFFPWVRKTFFKSEAKALDDDFVSTCGGVCKMVIGTDWLEGKENVLIDGKPALLGRCKLQCGLGGLITFYTSGQVE